jgi:hypothetical protein
VQNSSLPRQFLSFFLLAAIFWNLWSEYWEGGGYWKYWTVGETSKVWYLSAKLGNTFSLLALCKFYSTKFIIQ